MDTWLISLLVKTPQEGFELDIKLARISVNYKHPDAETLNERRNQFDHNAQFLIAASQGIVTQYQTVAKVNSYWK